MKDQNSIDKAIIDKVYQDIDNIEEALESNDSEKMFDVHSEIDATYQSAIINWGMSMNCYNPNFGFDIYPDDTETLRLNLKKMKAKLRSYSMGLNVNYDNQANNRNQNVSVNVNNNNSNVINLTLTFEQARKQVEETTALSQEQTNEVIEKINEIERISKEKEPKKKKWEKIKPILAFALDKGVDIAIMLWSLALQSGLIQHQSF